MHIGITGHHECYYYTSKTIEFLTLIFWNAGYCYAVGVRLGFCIQNSKCTQYIILDLSLKLYIITSVSV
jgi:hypothetical protein